MVAANYTCNDGGSVVKAGGAIPVKFSLGGNFGLNIFAANYPASQMVNCNSSDRSDAIEETVAAGGSSLSYNATTNQYTYPSVPFIARITLAVPHKALRRCAIESPQQHLQPAQP